MARFLLLLFFLLVTSLTRATPASAQLVVLKDFIDGRNHPAPGYHELSTGERIEYVDEPADASGRDYFRMLKGGNYEQFYINTGTGEIGRREDTSWAPLPGFQPAYCSSGAQAGDQAIYTVGLPRTYAPGETITDDGGIWAPRSKTVGDSWLASFQITPVSKPAAVNNNQRIYCQIADPLGYPTATSTRLVLARLWNTNSLTFCTGIKNPAPTVEIRIVAGPGTGDIFYFMQKWGLVGFTAPGFEAGLMGPGANRTLCQAPDPNTTPTPQPPKDPRLEGFDSPLKYPCDVTVPRGLDRTREFHPLRPYPGSPCDPLIPQSQPEAPRGDGKLYQSFACGKSLNAEGVFKVPADMDVASLPTFPTIPELADSDQYYKCSDTTDTDICIVRRAGFDVTVDLSAAELPILGNTQLRNLDDASLANNFLSWYLNGTIEHSEQKELDPNNPLDIDRLINYSGPLKKLLPQSTQDQIRDLLTNEPPVDADLHDYLVQKPSTRLTNAWEQIFKNVPFASLEDTVSEIVVSLIPNQQPGNYSQFDPGLQSALDAGNGSHGVVYTTTNGRNRLLLTITGTEDTADSRLYFPHLRNLNYLSYLTYRLGLPKDINSLGSKVSSPDQRIPDQDHQQPLLPDYLTGGDDTRNTENPANILGDNPPAALPLFENYDQRCDLKEVRFNPGDTLYGKSIQAHLVYTQKTQYSIPPRPTPLPGFPACTTGCPSGNCCNQDGSRPDLPEECPGYSCEWRNDDPYKRYCTATITTNCGTYVESPDDIELPTEARVAVFTKTPFIERIYNALISAPDSFLRRLVPAQECKDADGKTRPCDAEDKKHYIRNEAETFPGAAPVGYNAAGKATAQFELGDPVGHPDQPEQGRATAGDKSGGPQIYYARLGSLFDYFLGAGVAERFNLQKLLRPQGFTSGGIIAGQGGNAGSTGTCAIPSTGYCSLNDPVTQLTTLFSSQAPNAAQICNAESGGDAEATNYIFPDYSIGLFQINLLCAPRADFVTSPAASTLTSPVGTLAQIISRARSPARIGGSGRQVKSCYDAWWDSRDYNPTENYIKWVCANPGAAGPGYLSNNLVDSQLRDDCEVWFKQPLNNATYAYFHSGGGQNWAPWSTAATCNIVGGSTPLPPALPNTAYILRGSTASANVIASTSTEIATPTVPCSWVNSKGITSTGGGVNANYFKVDSSPVGWAGYGSNNASDYGVDPARPIPATRSLVVRSDTLQVVPSSSVSRSTDSLVVSGRELEFNPGVHHRTGVGLLGSEILLFVIPNATAEEFVAFAASLGLTNSNALQLDGGGSSTMCQGNVALFGNSRQVPVSLGLRSGTITQQPVSTPPPVTAVKILALGDSITSGGSTLRGDTFNAASYLCPLKNQLTSPTFLGPHSSPESCSVSHAGFPGLPGRTTDWMNNNSHQWIGGVPTGPNSYVLIHLGTNDVFQGLATGTSLYSLNNIMAKIRAANPQARIILSKVIPTSGFANNTGVDNFNLDVISRISGVTLVDPRNDGFTYADVAALTTDGLHPNTLGAQKISQTFYDAIH